jgi:hypothetical protein
MSGLEIDEVRAGTEEAIEPDIFVAARRLANLVREPPLNMDPADRALVEEADHLTHMSDNQRSEFEKNQNHLTGLRRGIDRQKEPRRVVTGLLFASGRHPRERPMKQSDK